MEESNPGIKGEDFREGRARGGTALARTKNVHVLLRGRSMDQGSPTDLLFRLEL